jgi:hypothetical protein
MALSLQLNVYSNPLKLCDMLNIRKAIFIRKFENSVILLKLNKQKIYKIESKIFPIAVWTRRLIMIKHFIICNQWIRYCILLVKL